MTADTGSAPGALRTQLVFLLLALSLTSVGLAQGVGNRPLVISGSNWITDAPTHLAGKAGYFGADAGPEIRVELADSGKQSLDRLLAGEADFALMAAVPLAMELLRLEKEPALRAGRPLVLASIGLSNSTHHVIADAARGIEQPGDLDGHAIGLLVGSSAHYGWDRFADYHQISPDSVRLVNTSPERLAEALSEGRVDAVVTWTPYSERIMTQLQSDGRRFPLDAMDSVSWLLVSTRSTIDNHPDEVRRVLQGYARAIEMLQSEPDRAVEMLGQPPGWSEHGRVAWKLALDWPSLFNVEDKMGWGAGLLGVERPRLSPAAFIAREPLERYRPGAVTLPIWLGDGDGSK
ncbi:MAG: hypothetical protein CMP07_04740 [Xanthomonadales bacterium]|nr:hypothetical protein [Xanthomonadales bacterium]